MCRNQLGRRNLTAEQTAYIIRQEYEAQCKTNGGTGANQYTKEEQVDPSGQAAKTDTRAIVAKAHGVSEHFVQNAVEFGRGLDAAEAATPGIRDAVLSGEVKAPEISGLSNKYAIRPVEAPASDVSALAVFLYS